MGCERTGYSVSHLLLPCRVAAETCGSPNGHGFRGLPQARTGNVEWAEGLPSRCEALGSVPSTILQKPGQHLGTGGRRIRNLRLSSAT